MLKSTTDNEFSPKEIVINCSSFLACLLKGFNNNTSIGYVFVPLMFV